MWNPKNAFHVIENKEVKGVTAALKMKVLYVAVETQEQLENAFAQIRRDRPQALLVLADRVFLHNRASIMDFSVQHRLPGIYAYLELVEAGGLMSYGPKQGLEKLAEIREQDILTVDLSQANVLTMYLLPSVDLKLRPKILSEMAPGSRVVSHAFDMVDWKSDNVVQVNGRNVNYWTVPKEVLSGIRRSAFRSICNDRKFR